MSTASTDKDTVSVAGTAQRVQIVVRSEPGSCFALTDQSTGRRDHRSHQAGFLHGGVADLDS